MNEELQLFSSIMFKGLFISLAIVGIFCFIFRRKFLLSLKTHETSTWIYLGSPSSTMLFSPFMANKVEAFIANKEWLTLKSNECLNLGRKAYVFQRLQLLLVVVLLCVMFAPLLMKSFSA